LDKIQFCCSPRRKIKHKYIFWEFTQSHRQFLDSKKLFFQLPPLLQLHTGVIINLSSISNLNILRVARWVIAPTRQSAAVYAAATVAGMAAAVIAAQNQSRLAAALGAIGSAGGAKDGATGGANALVDLAIWSAVAAVAAAVRGAVFTALHQRMYARLAAAVFGRVRAADMAVWDVEWRENDLARTAVSDVQETVSAATLLVNVTLRNAATIVCVIAAWRGVSSNSALLWVGLAACAAHLTLAAVVHPWNQRAGDAARAAKQEGEAVMQEFVQKHTGVLLCAWQEVYGQLASAAATNYAARGNAEVAAYAAAIAASQIFPRLGELAVIAALVAGGVNACASASAGASAGIIGAAFESIGYYHMLTGAVNECKDQWVATWRQRVAISRIWQILQRPDPAAVNDGLCTPANVDDELFAPARNSVVFENVTFSYPTAGAPVLRDFSLVVQPGELVVLRGKSGRGKTTLLKLLLGLYAPDAGTVTICGKSPRANDRPRADLRRMIAVSPQDPLYFPQQTLRENIEMGLSLEGLACARERAQASERALARAGLGELAGRLDARVVELSGGQRQRLAVARVLLRNGDQPAPVVVLDEPTAALDDETAAEVVAALAAHLAETGAAAIWITHQHQVVPPHPRIRTVHL